MLLGDSLGEMAFYYAACDVAIVAGSFAPLGGQNLIEACAAAVPVIVGPHTFNFQQAAIEAIEAGGVLRAADAGQAVQVALELLKDDARRQSMGRAGGRGSRRMPAPWRARWTPCRPGWPERHRPVPGGMTSPGSRRSAVSAAARPCR